MTGLIVGADIGGTKTQIAASEEGRLVANKAVSSSGWAPAPASQAAAWLASLLEPAVPRWRTANALVIGAHGCDSPEVIRNLQGELEGRFRGRCLVVNDAQLVLPAMSLHAGVGVVAGTGSVAAGTRRTGGTTIVGGWGWLLGDEGSAPSIVREAIRAVLLRRERGLPDDELTANLLRAFDTPCLEDLPTRAGTMAGKTSWGQHAPLVFEAAAAGSTTADEVIRLAGQGLAGLVHRLQHRGIDTNDVVLAGGVLRAQPQLVHAVRESLAQRGLKCQTQLLTHAPVTGALVLGRQLLAQPAQQVKVPALPGRPAL